MATDYKERLRTIELEQELARYQEDITRLDDAFTLQQHLNIALVASIFIALILVLYFIRKVYVKNKELVLLRKTAEDAKISLENREKFVAFVNHEIRTPLNAVSGSASLLQVTNLDVKQKKYVQTIKASVDNVLTLVNDVLDLSRAESGKLEFRQVDFILDELINGVIYILQEKAETKGLELKIDKTGNIPQALIGDSAHLNQILLNLANNAVKFTDLGKVTVLVERMPDDEDGSIWLRFNVTDTGKGIRQSKLNSIFDQFEQETRHTIKHKGGSGLGLAITKQLVEKQGGKIYVTSKYLEGSTFSVELKFGEGDLQKAMRGRKPENINVNILTGLAILVVDDNQLNRDILQDLLLGLNPEVKIYLAESAKEAYQSLENNNIDIVLMDIQMPDINGYDAARSIRLSANENISKVAIFAMTAHALEDVSTKCFEAGMNDYVAKPIDLSFLITKIERYFSRQKVEKMPEWKYIDLIKLKEAAGGDHNKMLKYLNIYSAELPIDLVCLNSARHTENKEEIEAVLHKIKGSLSYIGDHAVATVYTKITSISLSNEKFYSMVDEAIIILEETIKEITLIQQNHKLLPLNSEKPQ